MTNNSNNCAVRIAVRERPFRPTCDDLSCIGMKDNIIIVDGRAFVFDNVIGPSISQKDVFENLVEPLVNKVVEGFNCTALAYGQTGTGKSYTMGLDCDNYEAKNAGLIPRCLKKIFMLTNDEKTELYASFIEIYNEKLYDLFSDNITEPIVAKGYKFTGGIKKELPSLQDCYNLLRQGSKNRHVRPTKMNLRSSRSHAIFTIHVRSTYQEKVVSSCLNLVDLAGSEGVRRTGHQGVALSEGVHINQGLLSITKVLQAMTLGSKVIPYRDSVLSSVLQDSLNPNSYLTLLACISPHREDLSETLSTLRFAQNAKQLKHTPQINSVLSEIKKHNTKMYSNGNVMPKKFSCGIELEAMNKKTPKTRYGHNNTFCTPSKIKKITSNKQNRTITELTPTEKLKVRSTIAHGQVFQYNSLFDPEIESIDSRSSLLSVNISTSTEIEGPSQPTSYSPVVRKCMAAFENAIESKMSKMMESIKVLAHQNGAFGIVRNESQFSNSENVVSRKPKALEYTSPIGNLENNIQNNYKISGSRTSCARMPLRRSQRLSSMIEKIEDETFKTAIPRSRRLSVKQLNDQRRNSIKLASQKEEDESNINDENTVESTSRKKQRKKRQNGLNINNSVIEAYFENGSNVSNAHKTISHAKHRKAILDLLNNGSVKDLQRLPQIGLKTAYQIVTQRTLNGRLKSLSQVEKLPIWRGSAWERFAKANILI